MASKCPTIKYVDLRDILVFSVFGSLDISAAINADLNPHPAATWYLCEGM